ncbi:MAG: homoserine dehydrogenase [Chloroflexota bacterium]|nr:homoserine dehydrogenase [Chloroflexota bacterium]
MRKEIGVGMLGLGVVGSGVARALTDKTEELAGQIGASLALKRVLVRDPNKKRSISLEPGLLTTNAREVINNSDVDIVIEVIGGEYPALDYINQAINSGKHVVTANKEVIAKHGYKLLSSAQAHNVDLRYEASVGSGIPLISAFQQDLAANDISAIHAILNGTTNYILTEMAQGELDFPSALKQAQQLGYAEPDPANDIDGTDASYKLAILASLAFHVPLSPKDIYREGISRLAAQDFRYAREFGYVIKLLAIARQDGEAIEARVHPTFTPQNSQLAKVDGVYNAIQVQSNLAGKLVFYGPGAGALPTTSAIMADVLTIARNICRGVNNTPRIELSQRLAVKAMSNVHTRYYFRLNVVDRPGVLAQISKVLGDNLISISSVLQKESNPESQTAEIVIMTHPAEEKGVQKALKEVNQLPLVNEVSNFIRVEG